MKLQLAIAFAILVIIGLYVFLSNKPAYPVLPRTDTENVTNPEITPEAGVSVSITTVYDNYLAALAADSGGNRLRTGWGFSALVTLKDQNILFDAGADSGILLSNMAAMEIAAGEIDTVFISHRHGDHTGGLTGLRGISSNLKVLFPESFSRPAPIAEDVWTTGFLENPVKEQSLVIRSGKGLIIITGCSHPGIVNIVKKAVSMFPDEKLYLVMGGFHLSEAPDNQLNAMIKDLRSLGVRKVAPSHCSGKRCRELFQQAFRDDFVDNGVGGIITIE
jgi:7,8-dihydropterin-6-yl-methyl-4-(beta-D-ribofuranosyl)aminobenzene 5'-phosphate synthase